MEYDEEFPLLCDECLGMTLATQGREPLWNRKPEDRAVSLHAALERTIRCVYILKLTDGTFYVGQSNDLLLRLEEHRDGQQAQTRGKTPKLVYYEAFEGSRDDVTEREKELTVLNQSGAGRRRLRDMIERFRAPLRLLDLEA